MTNNVEIIENDVRHSGDAYKVSRGAAEQTHAHTKEREDRGRKRRELIQCLIIFIRIQYFFVRFFFTPTLSIQNSISISLK